MSIVIASDHFPTVGVLGCNHFAEVLPLLNICVDVNDYAFFAIKYASGIVMELFRFGGCQKFTKGCFTAFFLILKVCC